MTKRKRYLFCGHGESLPMAEDDTTSLSSMLEDLAVEVCAEAVSARRRVNEEHFDFVWVSCCEGAEPSISRRPANATARRRPSIL